MQQLTIGMYHNFVSTLKKNLIGAMTVALYGSRSLRSVLRTALGFEATVKESGKGRYAIDDYTKDGGQGDVA